MARKQCNTQSPNDHSPSSISCTSTTRRPARFQRRNQTDSLNVVESDADHCSQQQVVASTKTPKISNRGSQEQKSNRYGSLLDRFDQRVRSRQLHDNLGTSDLIVSVQTNDLPRLMEARNRSTDSGGKSAFSSKESFKRLAQSSGRKKIARERSRKAERTRVLKNSEHLHSRNVNYVKKISSADIDDVRVQYTSSIYINDDRHDSKRSENPPSNFRSQPDANATEPAFIAHHIIPTSKESSSLWNAPADSQSIGIDSNMDCSSGGSDCQDDPLFESSHIHHPRLKRLKVSDTSFTSSKLEELRKSEVDNPAAMSAMLASSPTCERSLPRHINVGQVRNNDCRSLDDSEITIRTMEELGILNIEDDQELKARSTRSRTYPSSLVMKRVYSPHENYISKPTQAARQECLEILEGRRRSLTPAKTWPVETPKMHDAKDDDSSCHTVAEERPQNQKPHSKVGSTSTRQPFSSSRRSKSAAMVIKLEEIPETPSNPILIKHEGKLFHHAPLPSGWQIRVSKSKKRPYYVHPDWGITWHCPIMNPLGPQAMTSVTLADSSSNMKDTQVEIPSTQGDSESNCESSCEIQDPSEDSCDGESPCNKPTQSAAIGCDRISHITNDINETAFTETKRAVYSMHRAVTALSSDLRSMSDDTEEHIVQYASSHNENGKNGSRDDDSVASSVSTRSACSSSSNTSDPRSAVGKASSRSASGGEDQVPCSISTDDDIVSLTIIHNGHQQAARKRRITSLFDSDRLGSASELFMNTNIARSMFVLPLVADELPSEELQGRSDEMKSYGNKITPSLVADSNRNHSLGDDNESIKHSTAALGEVMHIDSVEFSSNNRGDGSALKGSFESPDFYPKRLGVGTTCLGNKERNSIAKEENNDQPMDTDEIDWGGAVDDDSNDASNGAVDDYDAGEGVVDEAIYNDDSKVANEGVIDEADNEDAGGGAVGEDSGNVDSHDVCEGDVDEDCGEGDDDAYPDHGEVHDTLLGEAIEISHHHQTTLPKTGKSNVEEKIGTSHFSSIESSDAEIDMENEDDLKGNDNFDEIETNLFHPRVVEVNTGDSISTLGGEKQLFLRNLSKRILYPPHPLCSLQKLQELVMAAAATKYKVEYPQRRRGRPPIPRRSLFEDLAGM